MRPARRPRARAQHSKSIHSLPPSPPLPQVPFLAQYRKSQCGELLSLRTADEPWFTGDGRDALAAANPRFEDGTIQARALRLLLNAFLPAQPCVLHLAAFRFCRCLCAAATRLAALSPSLEPSTPARRPRQPATHPQPKHRKIARWDALWAVAEWGLRYLDLHDTVLKRQKVRARGGA